MRLHFQNLSDDRRGRTVGSIFRNGRAWLYLGADGPTVRWSWHFKSRDRLVHLHANNAEHGLHSSIAGLGVFLSFGIDLPWKWLPEWWHELTERQLGISDHDGSLWFDFFAEQDRSPSRGPFGIRLDPSWSYIDFLLGKASYETETLEQRDTHVPMPEKVYAATVEIFESKWRRPRWFTKRMLRATIEVEGGIPIPGKGTESWNCGEDASFGLTCKATTVEEAVGEMVKNCLETRARYGGRNWTPNPKKPKKRRA